MMKFSEMVMIHCDDQMMVVVVVVVVVVGRMMITSQVDQCQYAYHTKGKKRKHGPGCLA
jgi:hypothetical protein